MVLWRVPFFLIFLAFAQLVGLLLSAPLALAHQNAFSKEGRSDLEEYVSTTGRANVIVGFKAPVRQAGVLPESVRKAYHKALEKTRDAFVKRVTGVRAKEQRRFRELPYIVLEVDANALAEILADPDVASVEVDKRLKLHLFDTPAIVQANLAWASGYHGEGQTVVILDTGVDTSHPFFTGKIVAEACFSTPGTGVTSLCPSGQSPQFGPGSGVYCPDLSLGCYHGTHVAGISAGLEGQLPGGAGMAPAASIIPIQVFTKVCDYSGCSLSAEVSDLISAMEWVYSQQGAFNVAAVNMSLGSDAYSNTCDTLSPVMKSAMDLLRSVDIATVVSSGNDGFTNKVSFPACISTSVSVGSTDKQNQVSIFSNAASFLSLLAPGQSIYSSYPGGGYAYLSGTSMAAPHVTGTWALLKAARPLSTVQEILNALQTTGLPILDSRQGLVKPLIQIGNSSTSQGALGAILSLPGAKTNYALSYNGGVASASSVYGDGYAVASINNGDRTGAGWASGGGWNDATSGIYPDWVQIDFNGQKTISEIYVVTLQDNYTNPVDPIDTMIFSLYGITAFDVQYWTGTAWATVPAGSVVGNTNVLRRFSFSPITTQKIRVQVNNSLGGFSRIVEVEAWGVIGAVNLPPLVSLTAPVSGAVYTAPADISLTASATDSDGVIAKVEFFQGAIKLGEVLEAPYTLLWPGVPAGNYVITAVATDDLGATATSAQVGITVTDPGTIILDQDLFYSPVNPPCRIFDTRNYNGGIAPAAGSFRHYNVHGDAVVMAAQGGNTETGCPAPKGEPMAIAANFTVVPVQSGYLRIYPYDGQMPTVNWLNFTVGTNISNAGVVSTAYLDPTGYDLTVYNGAQTHHVGDIMGYFYSISHSDPSCNEVKDAASTSGSTAISADGAVHMAAAFMTHTTEATDSVHITASQALGTSIAGGASGLDLWPCYRVNTPQGAPVTIGGGMRNLQAANLNRITMTVSGVVKPGAGKFDFGLCYRTSNPNWNNNEKGYVSTFVLSF